MDKKRLRQVSPGATGLGQPTIMDRTLAAQYGADYVHLAVFAIDVDRVFNCAPAESSLPFAWEVFLCAAHVVGRIDGHTEAGRALLEDTVLQILAEPPGEPLLGGVLAFAVHGLVERDLVADSLTQAFASWRSRPTQLRKALDRCFADGPRLLARAALHCLGTRVDPPLSPPTLEALTRMSVGEWTLAEPGSDA